jgi:hypothetical protein
MTGVHPARLGRLESSFRELSGCGTSRLGVTAGLSQIAILSGQSQPLVAAILMIESIAQVTFKSSYRIDFIG